MTLKIIFKIFFIIGKSQAFEYHLNDCQNLPRSWQNKSSSVLTDACVVLFTKPDCKIEKAPQLFTNMKFKFSEKCNSMPSKIPNNDFNEHW